MACTIFSSDQCSGGTPAASGWLAGYGPDKAFDNSISSLDYWYENSGDDDFPQWISYDFGSGNDREIIMVRIYPSDDYGSGYVRLKDFKVQYSDNNSDWYDADTFQCANSGEQWYEFEFTSVGSHRYWRLYITSTWDTKCASIWEIEMLLCEEEVFIADDFTLADSIDADAPIPAVFTDNITLSDSVDAQNYTGKLSDNLTLDDSTDRTIEAPRGTSEDVEFSDYINAYSLTDTLADDLTLDDAIDFDFEVYRGFQDDFTFSDSADALNWTKWFRDNADRAVKLYYLTITGSADSTTDIEIPMESFQGRKKSGYPTYLSVVIPWGYETEISARSNGQIVVEMAYKIGGEISIREEIIRADIEDIRIDEGSRRGSITIFGYRTHTFASQAVSVPNPVYRNVTDGKIRYRFATPDPFLNPGDVCTVGSDQFTVDSVNYVVSTRQQTMEVIEV